MNLISKILLGAVVLAAFACLWFLLTQKNKSTCCGNCAGCTTGCAKKESGK